MLDLIYTMYRPVEWLIFHYWIDNPHLSVDALELAMRANGLIQSF